MAQILASLLAQHQVEESSLTLLRDVSNITGLRRIAAATIRAITPQQWELTKDALRQWLNTVTGNEVIDYDEELLHVIQERAAQITGTPTPTALDVACALAEIAHSLKLPTHGLLSATCEATARTRLIEVPAAN